MTCRSCGIAIADKAIVCYRCGASTDELAPTDADFSRSRLREVRILLPILSLIGALTWWLIPKTSANSWGRWVVGAGLAFLVYVAVRVIKRSGSGRLPRR